MDGSLFKVAMEHCAPRFRPNQCHFRGFRNDLFDCFVVSTHRNFAVTSAVGLQSKPEKEMHLELRDAEISVMV